MHLTFNNVNDAFTWLVSGIARGLEVIANRKSHDIPTTPDTFRDTPTGIPHLIPTVASPSRYGDVYRIPGPVILTYLNPCQRVLWNVARDCNPFFHLIESIWMLAGRNDLEPLVYFNKKMANFSDDGKTLWGAYGYRWRHAPASHIGNYDERPSIIDQIQSAINILRRDPFSRRCVLEMWNPGDLLRVEVMPDCCDVPCNTTIMFDIRNGLLSPAPTPSQCLPSISLTAGQLINAPGPIPQSPPKKTRKHQGSTSGTEHEYNQFLDMTVINRSNDLVWGTLGANYVHMSFLQEYIACALGIQVGVYNQISNNQHVYANNWFPEKWLFSSQPDPYMSRPDAYPNPPLFNRTPVDHIMFDNDTHFLFGGPESSGPDSVLALRNIEGFSFASRFFSDTVKPMIQAFNLHLAREYTGAIIMCERITCFDWRLACKQWLQRRQASYAAKASSTSGIES